MVYGVPRCLRCNYLYSGQAKNEQDWWEFNLITCFPHATYVTHAPSRNNNKIEKTLSDKYKSERVEREEECRGEGGN
jgi:hypothetical protein